MERQSMFINNLILLKWQYSKLHRLDAIAIIFFFSPQTPTKLKLKHIWNYK